MIDLLAAIDAAIATGKIDPDKLVIWRLELWRHLADYTIASTTRFQAASSGAGMGNLIVLYGIDEHILQYENEIGPPWKNADFYLKLSYPFFHADRIKTPTLFMGGDKDLNVPVEGGEQMYQPLKSVGYTGGADRVSGSVPWLYPAQLHQGQIRAVDGMVRQVS